MAASYAAPPLPPLVELSAARTRELGLSWLTAFDPGFGHAERDPMAARLLLLNLFLSELLPGRVWLQIGRIHRNGSAPYPAKSCYQRLRRGPKRSLEYRSVQLR